MLPAVVALLLFQALVECKLWQVRQRHLVLLLLEPLRGQSTCSCSNKLLLLPLRKLRELLAAEAALVELGKVEHLPAQVLVELLLVSEQSEVRARWAAQSVLVLAWLVSQFLLASALLQLLLRHWIRQSPQPMLQEQAVLTVLRIVLPSLMLLVR